MIGFTVLGLIFTYLAELIFFRIILNRPWKDGLKKFDSNKDILMEMNFSSYQLGSSHLYDTYN